MRRAAPKGPRRIHNLVFARIYRSTTLRQWTIRLLKFFGVKQFQARSGIDQPFICHLGDFMGEGPFINADAHRSEVLIMAAWCDQFERPIVFDVGGNVGFVATQTALLLMDKSPSVYSFEPVPYTFRRLVDSVRRLELEEFVHPICTAMSAAPGLTRLSYSETNTMLAQVFKDEPNKRVGDKVAFASVLTIDQTAAAMNALPCLIKVDVEGHEVEVFKGAKLMLSQPEAPGICFELNPLTLSESLTTVDELVRLFDGYEFYYVNDFEGQRMEFGEQIAGIDKIDWVCNVFAVPRTDAALNRWQAALHCAAAELAALRN